jgi:hypothetical protein
MMEQCPTNSRVQSRTATNTITRSPLRRPPIATRNRAFHERTARSKNTAPSRSLIAGKPKPSSARNIFDEQPRPVANVRETDDRYEKALERENEFLRGQIIVKDTQIKNLTEHSQQTNVLMQSFQRLLAPLLGSGEGGPSKINSSESMGSV